MQLENIGMQNPEFEIEKGFVTEILRYIELNDVLHFKKVHQSVLENIRSGANKFIKTKQYSCKSQHEAYLKVYSNPEVMGYYMNALLISQILWTHHFKMLMFFGSQLDMPYLKSTQRVLDIGPGHGFFSHMVSSTLPFIDHVDIVDISVKSLEMTQAIIGENNGKIKYFLKDVFDFDSSEQYDLIILGEVLEHLDQPLLILKKLKELLNPDGYLWITTPTNAPAIDHVFLFRSREEIKKLIEEAGLEVSIEFGCYAEEVTPEIAEKFSVSYLYGAFLQAKE